MRVAILDARNSSRLVQQMWEVRSPRRARPSRVPIVANCFFRAARPRRADAPRQGLCTGILPVLLEPLCAATERCRDQERASELVVGDEDAPDSPKRAPAVA